MLNFQIGKKYRRRNGEIVTMTGFDLHVSADYGRVVNFDIKPSCWERNGRIYYSEDRQEDIIEEVKENEMKIEVGKWYKTRGGAKVFVGMYVPNGKNKPYVGYQVNENDVYFCDMCWFDDGTFTAHTPMHAADIIEEWKEPKSGAVYVNIFRNEDGDDNGPLAGTAYATRSSADYHGGGPTRLACVRVEWKEGQFDE